MSAATPLSASTTDQKPREPSMEEILASIRRIIADDQSLPGHGFPREQSATTAPPIDQHGSVPASTDSAASAHASERSFDHGFVAPHTPAALASSAAIEDRPASPNDLPDSASLYRSVSAPQFAGPAGPVLEPVPVPTSYHEPATSPETSSVSAAEYNETAAKFSEDHEASIDHYAAESVTSSEAEEGPLDVSPAYEQPYDVALDRAEAHGHEDQRSHQDQHGYEDPALFSTATDSSITSAFNMLAATRLADNSEELKSLVREMIRPLLRGWLDDNLPSMVERMVRAEIERVARGGR